MAEKNNKVPENVPGKYYVDDQCIACALCPATAAANFKMNHDESHAYVYKQPAGFEEQEACKTAMDECPTNCIGNDGE